MGEVIVLKEKLEELIAGKLEKEGVSAEHSAIVAEVLAHADLRGVHSHGALRTEHYITRIQAGGLNVNPDFKVEETGPASAKFDGDDGLGHVIAKEAMDVAIKMAQKSGIGVVTAFNSSHCGALSYYVKQAAEANMVGMAMTHTDKVVVPFGGKESFFGTNPIAYGFPSKKYKPVILDMATSNVAFGKVLHARETGQTIPSDWGVDQAGKPSTNPHEVASLMPFAGPKGYGMGMVVDVLSGILAGAAFGPHITAMYGNYGEMRKLGHFFMVINPAFFTDQENFLASMDRMVEELHAAPPADGFNGVMVPGEPEQMKEETRLKDGIPIAESIYQYLTKA
jgi:ureidoglycolate dehydrogenase (NAD+)